MPDDEIEKAFLAHCRQWFTSTNGMVYMVASGREKGV
jgi:hypothetical protein